MKTTRVLALLLVLALLAAACATGEEAEPATTTVPPIDTPPPTAGFLKADLARLTTTDVTDAELAALVAGNTEFALDLYGELAGEGNLILSPYSVAAALTMAYAGARNLTADEMRDVLQLALDDERIHAARNELDLRVTAEQPAAPDDEREPFTIRVANSLWGQEGYPFLEEYLALLAEQYDAGMNLVDFVAAAEEARITINDWVEEQTEGRIVDLIPQGVVDSMTRLVLVNAIWFKANWAEPFDEAATADAPFTLLDGSDVTASMMNATIDAAYAAGDGYQAVRIPYAGDAAMLVVLPDEGRFAEIRDGLDTAALDAIRSALSGREVVLGLPKFEIRSDVGLVPVLTELGMAEAFAPPAADAGADFTGITESRELYVSEVVHQAFIAVDEMGTEAAAATAVILSLTSAPLDPPVPMTIDRPFLYFIEHSSTGEILFLGQVTDPS